MGLKVSEGTETRTGLGRELEIRTSRTARRGGGFGGTVGLRCGGPDERSSRRRRASTGVSECGGWDSGTGYGTTAGEGRVG